MILPNPLNPLVDGKTSSSEILPNTTFSVTGAAVLPYLLQHYPPKHHTSTDSLEPLLKPDPSKNHILTDPLRPYFASVAKIGPCHMPPDTNLTEFASPPKPQTACITPHNRGTQISPQSLI